MLKLFFSLTDSTPATTMATRMQEPGGYEYEFVDIPADMLICKICLLPSREPVLSACCGHTFCKSCVNVPLWISTITRACPVCRDEEFLTIPNKQIERHIRYLHVYCTNKHKGCVWQGEVNDITNHLRNSDGCQHEDIQCPKGCGKLLQRQHIASHMEAGCSHRKF